MVTHDQDEALTLADRVAIMRNGRLEQLGSPAEVYQQPVSRFVAGFIGVSNFFRGRVERSGYVTTPSGLKLTVANRSVGDDVTIALRPEAVAIAPATPPTGPDSVLGTVEQVVYRGFISHTYLRLDNGETLIVFQSNQPGSAGGTQVVPGARVLARWSAGSNRIVHDDST
jgi:putative spermidine/putrescine transport system ATP-binding protein/spermidine/putrescine transport system ATP-binding protein